MTIKTTDIKTKLLELGNPVEELCLGDFDAIGEFTAKDVVRVSSNDFERLIAITIVEVILLSLTFVTLL